MRYNTPIYIEVNQTIQDIKEGVVSIFGEDLIGFYLTGSLTYDDFNPGRSDVDLVAIIKKPATSNQIKRLNELHKKVETKYPQWSQRIESQYVPEEFFTSKTPPKKPRPYYGAGVFYPEAPYGNEWLINLAMLFEYGQTLYGLDFRKIVPEIDYELVRQASLNDLHTEWLPKINDPEYLNNPHQQSYVVLNMCRILYTVRHSKIASKSSSAAWVKNHFNQWQDLVTKAQAWEYGQDFPYRDQTEAFILFVINQTKGIHEK